ncbi:MAG: hypothetical protein FWD28_08380 [Treponema sp.]|nr:hypothetical protein [Treponema sp.]
MKVDSSFRRKSFREAADAGILLWRKNFISFIPFFAVPLWVFAFTLRLILPGNYQYFSWLIIWFLKPLFDRLVLHVISIRFFEKDAGYKRLCKGIFKTMFRALPGDLLWRRFSPYRSAMMPMRVLERNVKKGAALKNRKNQLSEGGVDYCFLITIWALVLEGVFLYGEYIFLYLMNYEILNSAFYWDSFADIEIFIYAAWCFNLILIETLYVCMGFSLYINSRMMTEGWDIEILFRNFMEKIKNNGGKIAVIAILLINFIFTPVQLNAQDTQDTQSVPFESLEAVLDSPDFGGERDSWRIKLKDPPQNRNRRDLKLPEFNIFNAVIAHILRAILIAVIAVVVVISIHYLYKYGKNKFKKQSGQAIIALQKKSDERLPPAELLKKALRFNEAGELRLAWGYCTAAAIKAFSLYRGIYFPPNATEQECAGIVNQKADNSNEASAFGELIKNWVYIAYAKRTPPPGSFEEAVNLCRLIGCNYG